MLLAQVQSIPASTIGAVIVVIAALLGIGLGVKSLLARGDKTREIQPQPLKVEGMPTYISTKECKIIHAEINRRLAANEQEIAVLRQDMLSTKDDLMDRILKEVGAVHNRVNDAVVAIGELTGSLRELAFRRHTK